MTIIEHKRSANTAKLFNLFLIMLHWNQFFCFLCLTRMDVRSDGKWRGHCWSLPSFTAWVFITTGKTSVSYTVSLLLLSNMVQLCYIYLQISFDFFGHHHRKHGPHCSKCAQTQSYFWQYLSLHQTVNNILNQTLHHSNCFYWSCLQRWLVWVDSVRIPLKGLHSCVIALHHQRPQLINICMFFSGSLAW